MTESLKETEKKFDEEHGTPLSPDTLRAMRRRNRKAHRRSANVVCTCLILVIGCAIVECFALFNIEFCDGEDLMFLYWGFWCKFSPSHPRIHITFQPILSHPTAQPN